MGLTNLKLLKKVILLFSLICAIVGVNTVKASDPIIVTQLTTLPSATTAESFYPISVTFKNDLPFTVPSISVETTLSLQQNENQIVNLFQTVVATPTPLNTCTNVPSGGTCVYQTSVAIPEAGAHTLLLTAVYDGRRVNISTVSTLTAAAPVNPPLPPPPPVPPPAPSVPAYVLVGQYSPTSGDNSAAILKSSDGNTWSAATIPSDALNLWNVKYNGSTMFVAVGEKFSGDGLILRSTDSGATWVESPIPISDASAIYSVEWNGTIWVAVGKIISRSAVSALILTSPDGINWTRQSTPSLLTLGTISLNDVSWNGSYWMAVGVGRENPSLTNLVLTSLDGISWTSQPLPQLSNPFMGGQLQSIAWNTNHKYWLSVGSVVANPNINPCENGEALKSSNGQNWSINVIPIAGLFRLDGLADIVASGNIWVGVGSQKENDVIFTPLHGTVITSTDGVTWTRQTVPSGISDLSAIAWDGHNSRWLAGGVDNSMHGVLLTSPDAVTWTTQAISVANIGEINAILPKSP